MVPYETTFTEILMPTYILPFRYARFRNTSSYDSRNGPNTSYTATVNMAGVGSDNIRVRNSNPSWRQQVAKGVDASTPYSRTEVAIIDNSPCSYAAQSLNTGFTSTYDLFFTVKNNEIPGCPPASFPQASIADMALSNLKRRLREQTSEARAMAPIAECKDLHRLIRTATSYTSDMLLALKDLRKLRTKRAIRLMQDTWLSWNFGVNPMVRDINNIGQSIAKYLVRQDLHVRLVGSARTQVNGSFVPTYSEAPIYGASTQAHGSLNGSLKYEYVGAFKVLWASSNNYTLLNQLGLDLRSVPSTLWELTGFSWIADYFGTVGSYLEDAFSSSPSSLIYLNEIRKEDVTYTASRTQYYDKANANNMLMLTAKPNLSTVKISKYSRSVLGSLPVTAIRLRTVDELGLHSVSKLLNLVSLMKPKP